MSKLKSTTPISLEHLSKVKGGRDGGAVVVPKEKKALPFPEEFNALVP
ncbi:hypothetical protein [Pseudoalteromonas xiamenensis]